MAAQTRAQAPSYYKKAWYITVGGGYASNKAVGSMPDMVADIDRRDWGVKKEVQKNGGAFEINVSLQRKYSELFYLKTGLSYVQKQVNPEEVSYPLYKDSLKTGYLVLPALGGVSIPVDRRKTVFLHLEAGPCANVKLIDKTYHAPDRAGYKTFPLVLGVQAGGGVVLKTPYGLGVQLLYTFRQDITNATNESLYWGAPNEPIRTRGYKFRTNSFMIGLMWQL